MTAEDRSKPPLNAAETRRLSRASRRYGYFDPEEDLCRNPPDGEGRCPQFIIDGLWRDYHANILTMATGGLVAKGIAAADNVNIGLMVSACEPGFQSGGGIKKIDPDDPWAHPAWRARAYCQDQAAASSSQITGAAAQAVMAASFKGSGPVARSTRRKALPAFVSMPRVKPAPAPTPSPSAAPSTPEKIKPTVPWAWLVIPAALILLASR